MSMIMPPRVCSHLGCAMDPRTHSHVQGLEQLRTDKASTKTTLPTGSKERKDIPIYSGVMAYFPAALAYVAKISKEGNDKHNPGQPLHWARGKSMDNADTIARHLLEHGTIDENGLRHSGMLAWRALALLQLELEEQEGAPLSPGSRLPGQDV